MFPFISLNPIIVSIVLVSVLYCILLDYSYVCENTMLTWIERLVMLLSYISMDLLNRINRKITDRADQFVYR